MTSALFVLLGVAALAASLALMMAGLGAARLADTLAITAVLCGLAAFALVSGHSVQRARRLAKRSRP
ncbi:MAG TPA: hypothetical protein VIA61_02100 [Methylomirabilota bacterium]|jgi:hypothetical protein